MSGLALLLLATADGRAATHYADCDVLPDELLDALALVGPGDTVVVRSGPCDLGGTTVVLLEEVTIQGEDLPTLQGSANPLFRVAGGGPYTLEGLRIETTATGGALLIEASGTTLRDLELAGQPGSFAAITIAAGVTGTVLDGLVVTGFQGAGGPGGLHLQAGAAATLTDSRFEGIFGANGGAIRAESGATLDVIRTVFCGNVSTGSGGGIRSDGADLSVSASQFSGNSASSGSAIEVNGGTLDARHVDFAGNGGTSTIKANVSITVDSSMLFANAGVAIDAPAGSAASYDLFHQNDADLGGGATIGVAPVFADPLVMVWPGGVPACGVPDLRPGNAGSPLLGNGAPGDPVANIGQYGGADALPGWDDLDGDGDPYLDDCADLDPLIGPSAPDLCGDGLDNDCSGVVDDDPTQVAGLFEDGDGDGFGDGQVAATSCATAVVDGTDCNDASSGIHPGAAETCDHRDEDCTAVIDDVATPPWWGPDVDLDGVGTMAEQACFPSDEAYAEAPLPAGDCDDSLPEVRPGMPEVCYDGLDTDCDPATPEVGGTPIEWYADADGDGFGEAGVYREELTCADPGGGLVPAPLNTDCADTLDYVNPGRPEVCNGVDDDCDGLTDDDDPDLRVDPWYPDGDGDGAGDRFGEPVVACGAPAAGLVANADDCDDRDETRVGSLELWPDADGDGYGNADGDSIVACLPPPGYAEQVGDCNDGNPRASPGIDEVADDGVDNDCDGAIDELGGPGSRDDDRPSPAAGDVEAGCSCRQGGGGGVPALLVLALLRARRSGRSGRAARARRGPCRRCRGSLRGRRPTAPTRRRRSAPAPRG